MTIVFIGTIASSNIHFRGPLLIDLVKKGYKVYAFAFDYTQEQKEILLSMGVIPCDYQLSRQGLNPINELKLIYNLKKALEFIKPDIVFSFFIKPVIYGTIAAALARVPHRVAMLEGLGFVFTKQPEGKSLLTTLLKIVQVFLYNIIAPFSHRMIFLNVEDRNELTSKLLFQPKRVHVLGPIGLDLDYFSYAESDPGPIRFLFMGRLIKEKGINEFLKASEIVKKKYPTIEFLVIGARDRNSHNYLSDSVLEYYTKNLIITYGGEVADVREWLKKSSVFVLPSYREGYSRSTQEAMAIGRPVITTLVPGCNQTVVDGLNGFLIPPFQVSDLVNKMEWFINNPSSIYTMGNASRKFAEQNFNVHMVNEKLIHMIEHEI